VNEANEYKYLGAILSSDNLCHGHLTSLPLALRLENLLGFFIQSSISIQKHIPSYICTSRSVWDPHLKKDIERLEGVGVQKFGLKV